MESIEAFPNPLTMSSTTPASAVRVASLIDNHERRWFFGRADDALREVGLVNLPDVGEVVRQNPETLITCWSTPRLPDAWLESPACALRYVCHLTGSVRHVLPRSFIERGGIVSNWGTIPSGAVAEHALFLAIAALRNLPAWPSIFASPAAALDRMERLQVRTLFGRRIGIHGFGRVARSLVRLLAGFGSRITAFSEGVPEEVFKSEGVKRAENLRALFAESDVVFECEGLTPATALSVGAEELAALVDGGVVVNVARAGLIVEEALLAEARSGRIRVALDVYAEEPLPRSSPWRTISDSVLSPHLGGPTFDQYAQCAQLALKNITRYLANEPLQFLVTAAEYDRAT